MDAYDPLLLSRRRRAAIADGVRPADLRTNLWETGPHGVVRPAFVRHDPTTTRISDAVALMSSANALGGWAALRSQGNAWFDGRTRGGAERPVLVHCLPGSQLRRRPGIVPSEGLVHPDELVDHHGYRLATLARATFDELCRARGLREAVVVLDMATSTTSEVAHTTPCAVDAVVRAHPKVRGVVACRRALLLGSTRSASPEETRTRLVVRLDAGLTGLTVNTPVFDRTGRLLGIADLLDPTCGLVIESDGRRTHDDQRRTADYDRHESFERHGLTVCRVTAEHHADRLGLAARMVAARRDAVRRDRHSWTVEKPSWWTGWRLAPRWD